MNPELHAFFLDPSASGHLMHAELAETYRRACEQAGPQHELIAYTDEFEFLVEEVRELLRDRDEYPEYPEYASRLADFRDALRDIDRRRAEVQDLRILIAQRIDEIDELHTGYVQGLRTADDIFYEGWIESRQQALAEVERLRAIPDMAPHIERVLDNLDRLRAAPAAPDLAAYAEALSRPATPEPAAASVQASSPAPDIPGDPGLSPSAPDRDEPRLEPRSATDFPPPQPVTETAAVPPADGPLVWAGIGSRQTPFATLADMTELAGRMADAGWHLASGGANGADTAFAAGAPVDQRTIWLPWPRYNGLSGPDSQVPAPDRLRECLAIAARLHPAWDRCSDGARKLHARNVAILLGPNLDRPVNAVVCWTENGALAGGTGMALRIAAEHGIPVFNLGSMTREQVWERLQTLQRSLRPDTAVRSAEPGRKEKGAQSASRTYDPDAACVFRFTRDEWGVFSNFFPSIQAIDAAGHTFKTSEHLYQAAKFRGSPDIQARIAGASSASDAATAGRDTANTPDAGWSSRRIDAMRWVIRMKREANPDLVDAALQKTGDRPIVEYSRHDSFWGAQPQGDSLVGQNVLGRLWMELRDHIRAGDPRALSSAWDDPLSPTTVSQASAADPAAAPGVTTRRQFQEAAGNAWADTHENPAAAAATWSQVKTDYSSLYKASGDRIHHLPYQEGFTEFRQLVTGALQDGACPPEHRDRLQALHDTLEAHSARRDAVTDAANRINDACARLADLKEKMASQPGHTIETMPGYTAWLRDRDAAIARWRELADDHPRREPHRAHMQIVAPDMMAPQLAELSNHTIGSLHRASFDYRAPLPAENVYTASLQPLSRVYESALTYVDRDPRLLSYAPQFDELRTKVSTALDECSHAPDLVSMLNTLRTAMDQSKELRTRAEAATENVSRATHTLCSLKTWADRAGRPVHEAPQFKSWREEADRALHEYDAAGNDPALTPHLARADSLGVVADTALPMLRDERFHDPAVARAALAASRQRAEEAEEHYSMSA